MGLDLVAQGEVGAGIGASGLVELVAEGGQRLGAPGGGERVEPDEQVAGAGVDVAGGGQGLADERVCLVAGAGVVPVQGAGEYGLGVIGGHPDGVGDLLGLGVQPDHVRGEIAEPDPGGGGRGGGLGGFQFVIGGLDGGVELVELLVSQERGVAGGGAAQLEQAGVAVGFGRAGGGFSPPHPRGGGFLRRAGDQAVRVVGDRGVGVERVEGEVGARVAEVVLPPAEPV